MINALYRLVSFGMLLAALGASQLHAQVSAERPGHGGPPTIVNITTHIIDVPAIDNVNQQYTLDVFVNISWQDPRLALSGAEALGEQRMLELNELWMPTITSANNRGLEPRLPQHVTVDDFGHVVYLQRFFGSLAVDMDFKEFPFDTQILSIDLVTYGHDAADIQIVHDPDRSGMLGEFSVEGWVFSLLPVDNEPLSVIGLNREHPQLSIRLQAKREASYYLLTMMLPMSLILFMAWTVFWLPPNVVPSRVAVSTASIFSMIALGFSVRLNLPTVAYVTRADWFTLGATLLVFGALAVAVIGSRLSLNESDEAAERLNRIARWAYPMLYLLVVVFAGWA